jgi:hypothetical protein
MPWHDIEQGETLYGLAMQYGLEGWRQIYEDSKNKDFRQKRSDPGIVHPGDRVFIPNRTLKQHPSAVDGKHTFTVKNRKAYIRLLICDGEGKPLANKDYELQAEDATISGCLPYNGLLEAEAPQDACEGKLTVMLEEGISKTWTLQIGSMDPIEEISGIQARLGNLGFYEGSPDGAMNDQTRSAIWAFQARQGLAPTGEPNADFCAELKRFYTPE